MDEASLNDQNPSELSQVLIANWLQRLAFVAPSETENTQNNNPLDQLSRRKLEKKSSVVALSEFAASFARRQLLRLLARHVLSLSLIDYDPPKKYPLSVFEETEEDALIFEKVNRVCQEIQVELKALPDTAFNAYALAELQLWDAKSKRGLRKRTGSFYTPPALARHVVRRTLHDLHPCTRLIDPACGGGSFLLAALDELWEKNSGLSIKSEVSIKYQVSSIKSELTHNSQLATLLPITDNRQPTTDSLPTSYLIIPTFLYGLDLNAEAVDLARLALLRRVVELSEGRLMPDALLDKIAQQIRCGNAIIGKLNPNNSQLSSLNRQFSGPFLKNGEDDERKLAALSPFDWAEEWPEVFTAGGFDAVIGNPPYVGFNDYSGVEKAWFAFAYPEIYNLKNDLLYYFVGRGVQILRTGGKLGYVTSRFWKEAVYAAALRKWLLSHTRLLAIEDFGTEQHFKEALIDICLLFLEKNQPEVGHNFEFEFDGRREKVGQLELDPARKGLAWAGLRQNAAQENLTEKLNQISCQLGKIALCRTGVQTGRDDVFFVNENFARQLESDVLRRAIKSGDISPGKVQWRDLYLIYPPKDFDLENYPLLLNYFAPHEIDLERRSRYTKFFPYYQLQWPRDPEIFEAKVKLVTPYKARRNTFALDKNQLYFSTDVISVVFKVAAPLLSSQLEQFAVNFLNSRLSTFQFRSYSKPVGGGQYDYYANPVKQLIFPSMALAADAAAPDRTLLEGLAQPGLTQAQIDALVYRLYRLSDSEIALIQSSLPNFEP